MDSLAGHFLIASPSILDPNFHRAVVLITAHTGEGAVGVILNRCSDATVGEAVPQLAPVTDLDEPVFVGGPVNPEGVAVLAEFDDPEDAGVVVLGDVGLGGRGLGGGRLLAAVLNGGEEFGVGLGVGGRETGDGGGLQDLIRRGGEQILFGEDDVLGAFLDGPDVGSGLEFVLRFADVLERGEDGFARGLELVEEVGALGGGHGSIAGDGEGREGAEQDG